MADADRVHRYPIRVYFEDTDAGGMAYHANYLRWAERARTESLRAIGLPHQAMIERHNSLLVVRRIEVEYWRPARLDDLVVVETTVLKVTGAQVSVDQAGLKPVPLPEPWRSVLRDLMAPDPAPRRR